MFFCVYEKWFRWWVLLFSLVLRNSVDSCLCVMVEFVVMVIVF